MTKIRSKFARNLYAPGALALNCLAEPWKFVLGTVEYEIKIKKKRKKAKKLL